MSEHGPFVLYAGMLMRMQIDAYVSLGEHAKAFCTNERLEQVRTAFAVAPAGLEPQAAEGCASWHTTHPNIGCIPSTDCMPAP